MRRFAAILMSFTGCLAAPDYDGTQYLCAIDPVCPIGFMCQDGVCQAPGLPLTGEPRSLLKLDREAPAEPLENFPLLVRLSGAGVDRASMRDDASDLRFYDDAGAMIPHEIEQVTPAEIVAWVRVPHIEGTSTIVKVDYGRAAVPPALPAHQVWSADYAAVFHFASEPPRDSTRHERPAIDTNTTALAAGKIGSGRSFGGNGSIRLAADDLALAAFTISSWMQESPATSTHTAVTRGDDFWIGSTAGVFELFTAQGRQGSGSVGSPSAWTRVAVTADSAATAMYLNNNSRSGGGAFAPLSRGPIYIGSRAAGDFHDGGLDEVRIETVARSDAWVRAEYLSMTDALITYGPVAGL